MCYFKVANNVLGHLASMLLISKNLLYIICFKYKNVFFTLMLDIPIILPMLG